MRTVRDTFDLFHEALKLDPRERVRAEKMHVEITLRLQAAGIIVAAFLQGSFKRKTMLPPLHDVDKVVILADSFRGWHPDQVMDRIQAVLAPAYPDATFSRTRHSIKMDLGRTSFDFDIVPAFESPGADDDVLIADRELGNIDFRSNTRELIRVIAQRNADCKKLLVPEARMVKHAARHLVADRLPGLHAETYAYAAISCAMPYADACAATFDRAAAMLLGAYNDPTGRDQISSRLKPDVVADAQVAFAGAAAGARRAQQLAAAGEHENAIAEWYAIFGDPFPAPVPQTERDAFKSFGGGSISTTTGRVSATAAAGQIAVPARSWSPR